MTNTGSVDADDAVLGFVVPPGAGKDGVALKELFGFERVFVPAGQTVQVYLYPQLSAFSRVNVDGVREAVAGEYRVEVGVAGDSRVGFVAGRVVAA